MGTPSVTVLVVPVVPGQANSHKQPHRDTFYLSANILMPSVPVSPKLRTIAWACARCRRELQAKSALKMYVRVSRAKLQLEQNVVGSCAKVPCVSFSLSSPTCLLNCLTTYLPAYLPIYLCYAACHLSVLYRIYLACTETCSELFCTSGVHACTEASVMCRQPLATDLAFGVGALTLGM